MRMTLESTTEFVELMIDGVPITARVWKGTTDKGVQCHAVISLIAVDEEQDSDEFVRDLDEIPPPHTQRH